MKSNIFSLMKDRHIDAVVIDASDGLSESNSQFVYFAGDVHVSKGRFVITQKGITLFHGAMERDEAAKAAAHSNIPITCVDMGKYKGQELLKKHRGNQLEADLEMLKMQLADAGATGRVAFYGAVYQNQSWPLLNRLAQEEVCEVVGEYADDVLSALRETKDEAEVAHIREACRLTEKVIAAAKAFLQSHAVKDGALVKADGSPLLLGEVKRYIRLRMVEEGLEPNEFIFSQGRDAGIGHSTGNPADVMMLGKTIVFDIFPRLPGAYFADITRTWCLGYAPEHVLQAYQQVMEVHAACEKAFTDARLASDFQELACDIFEKHGHKTVRSEGTGLTHGYYHGLGHGIGLSVHEAPGMRLASSMSKDILRAGSVITLEPGLYYPDDPRGGWGVRIEDDYWHNPATGQFERLTNYDRELVVKM